MIIPSRIPYPTKTRIRHEQLGKIKMLCTLFLTINAAVFLVPMMPELVKLAESSVQDGEISQAFLDKAHKEQLVGMSNVIPLLLELLLGAFRPRLFGEPKTEK